MTHKPLAFRRRLAISRAVAEMTGKFSSPDGRLGIWSVARDVLQSTLGKFKIFPSRYYSAPGSLARSINNIPHVRSRIVAPIETISKPDTLSFDAPALVYSSYRGVGHVDFVRSSGLIPGIISGDLSMRLLNEQAVIHEVHLLEAK